MKRVLPEVFLARTRIWRATMIRKLARGKPLTREMLSHLYLRGSGLEIGSLNWPMPVPPQARVRYADAFSTEELMQNWPQFADSLKPIDVVTDVQNLAGVQSNSLDFVIANHVIEHTEDPIGALIHLHRVLKDRGILYMSLPDKRDTFDRDRPITSYSHLLRDHEDGGKGSRESHRIEIAKTMASDQSEEGIQAEIQRMATAPENPHFHVWDQLAMLEWLARAQLDFGCPFDLEALSKTGLETIFVFRKVAPEGS